MLGVVLGILAASSWGLSAILVRLGVQSLRPSTGTWVSLIPGLIVVMALAFLFNYDDIKSLAALAFLWFALSGLFNFALGRLLNAVSINMVGVAKAAPLFSTAPLFATILGVTLLGESITPWLLLGTFCVVAGIALITSEQAQR